MSLKIFKSSFYNSEIPKRKNYFNLATHFARLKLGTRNYPSFVDFYFVKTHDYGACTKTSNTKVENGLANKHIIINFFNKVVTGSLLDKL